MFIPTPTIRELQNIKDVVFFFFLPINTFKCVQMSFTKGGRGIYGVITPLKR